MTESLRTGESATAVGWDGGVATPESLIACTNRELPPILDPALPDSPIFWLATATRA